MKSSWRRSSALRSSIWTIFSTEAPWRNTSSKCGRSLFLRLSSWRNYNSMYHYIILGLFGFLDALQHAKKKAVVDWPQRTSLHAAQRFLGFTNFFTVEISLKDSTPQPLPRSVHGSQPGTYWTLSLSEECHHHFVMYLKWKYEKPVRQRVACDPSSVQCQFKCKVQSTYKITHKP